MQFLTSYKILFTSASISYQRLSYHFLDRAQRFVTVDTLGLILSVFVTAASQTEQEGVGD